MALKCRQVIEWMETLAPTDLAEQWDSVGLQVGSPQEEIKKIVVALDLDGDVVNYAVDKKANLIITHHPLFFRPLKNIRWDQPQGQLVAKLIRKGIMVFSAHTNLDSAEGGVNETLGKLIGLQGLDVLAPSKEEKLYKLSVYVPEGHADTVRDALGEAGAGWLGNYSHCTFQSAGVGTFRPLEGANPFIGQVGDLERVEEVRLETIVSEGRLQGALKGIRKVHPYEEVAYDIYPLHNKGRVWGMGRIGILPLEIPLQQFVEQVKASLGLEHLRVVGDLETTVRKVAVCGGSGASLIGRAASLGADVLITGDVKYHEAQEAEGLGIALIDAGHFATEYPVVERVADHLRSKLKESKHQTKVLTWQKGRDPFRFL